MNFHIILSLKICLDTEKLSSILTNFSIYLRFNRHYKLTDNLLKKHHHHQLLEAISSQLQHLAPIKTKLRLVHPLALISLFPHPLNSKIIQRANPNWVCGGGARNQKQSGVWAHCHLW
ncbi:hypothetical protein CEXT_280861 [Caerostris extrusa]|uniref:Uncharacterized protein n=1 Tax=Caerostris extrusa TaxID=172846 RepID=A0AAV4PDR5_CAEEX|nr:hypothetical protein CEXT_280861 [Caerostris extrusa]